MLHKGGPARHAILLSVNALRQIEGLRDERRFVLIGFLFHLPLQLGRSIFPLRLAILPGRWVQACPSVGNQFAGAKVPWTSVFIGTKCAARKLSIGFIPVPNTAS